MLIFQFLEGFLVALFGDKGRESPHED
jgi:hypothetical protein